MRRWAQIRQIDHNQPHMRHQNVVIFGGSGFVGSRIIARLVADGRRVRLVTRKREHAQALILLPTVDVIEGDPFDDAFLQRAMRGQDAVINLIGILHSDVGTPYGRKFARAHVEVVRSMISAARAQQVPRFLQMSALGAASDAPSMYLRSKHDGEQAVLESGLAATVFRPSVVFGPGDHFLNMFATLQRYFPVMPIACAGARFEPVFVGDVASAFFHGLDAVETYGRCYELVGPRIYTLKEIVKLAGAASGHPRPVWALPESLGMLQAGVMEKMPGPTLLSRDNLRSMKIDNIATGTCSGLEAPELGGATEFRPTPMEQVAFEMLAGADSRDELNNLRRSAHRQSQS
jgi:uncharacterized protein YbjT (DUF2867 family)